MLQVDQILYHINFILTPSSYLYLDFGNSKIRFCYNSILQRSAKAGMTTDIINDGIPSIDEKTGTIKDDKTNVDNDDENEIENENIKTMNNDIKQDDNTDMISDKVGIDNNRDKDEEAAVNEMERLLEENELNYMNGDDSTLTDIAGDMNGDNNNVAEERPAVIPPQALARNEPQIPPLPPIAAAVNNPLPPPPGNNNNRPRVGRMNYAPFSVIVAIVHVLYIIRTRRGLYPALLYITSSKASYVILGNASIALAVSIFGAFTKLGLGGLRPIESEQVNEKLRWDATEMCIALAMIRPEMSASLVVRFLGLVMMKCLHWAVELRGGHLRMTEEVFYFLDEDEEEDEDEDENHHRRDDDALSVDNTGNNLGNNSDGNSNTNSINPILQLWRSFPRLRFTHLRFRILAHTLLFCDAIIIYVSLIPILESMGIKLFGKDMKDGESGGLDATSGVRIFFGFEGSLLLASVAGTIGLYDLHIVDGCIQILQRIVGGKKWRRNIEGSDNSDGTGNQSSSSPVRFVRALSSIWLEKRAALNLSVEVLSSAARLLFYIVFFLAVYSTYGLPVHILREVYTAYKRLRDQLQVFRKYHRLVRDIDRSFRPVRNEKELEEAGKTCIVCRDRMEVGTGGRGGECIVVPGCGHIFHKHCLREWLTRQQTCPTCRGEIQVRESANKAEERVEQSEREERERVAAAEATGGVIEEIVVDRESGATPIPIPLTTQSKGEQSPVPPSSFKPSYEQFPRLYRVLSSHGAPVVELPKVDSIGASTVLRTISPNTFVVVLLENSTRTMLRMSDGWIRPEDVLNLGSLVVQK